MRFLLCNDDGFDAPGIAALHEAVKHLGEVDIVAPHKERSASSQRVTLRSRHPSRKFKRKGYSGHAVKGTPADCVKVALNTLLPERPDLLLSGINFGPNAGGAIHYSGTVGAAMEAVSSGLPAIAFSLNASMLPQWGTARAVVAEVLKWYANHPLPPNALLNVNIPNVPLPALAGYELTHMAPSRNISRLKRKYDQENETPDSQTAEVFALDNRQTDIAALSRNCVSLCPLSLDRCHHSALEHLRAAADLPAAPGWTATTDNGKTQ